MEDKNQIKRSDPTKAVPYSLLAYIIFVATSYAAGILFYIINADGGMYFPEIIAKGITSSLISIIYAVEYYKRNGERSIYGKA